MSDPYERVKGNRLTFKGGVLATSSKSIAKSKKKKKKHHDDSDPNPNPNPNPDSVDDPTDPSVSATGDSVGGVGEAYSIDAAKRMKYDELFPVEAKKFGYDPKAKTKSVEEALEDRVKKKADRYCK